MARNVYVNMEGVESYTRCPEGEWKVKLASIEEVTTKGSGEDALKAKFVVIAGAAKGNQVYETFSLGENALWKLKSFLEAIGMKADGKLRLNLDKLEGKVCVIDVTHDEYQGTKRAKISSYIKPEAGSDDEDDEDDEDEEEEDEPVKPMKKAASKKPAPTKRPVKKSEPEEEEDEDDDWDDEDNNDDDEEEEEKPKKPAPKAAKKPAPTKKAPAKPKKRVEEDDDDDDWEDDDD